jgi:hypothetical protein
VPISHGHGRSPPPVLANEGGPDKGVPPREGGLPASRFGLYPLVWGSLFWGHFARRCLTGMSAASFFNPAAQNQAQADRPHVVVAPLQGGVLSAGYEPHFRPAALQGLGQCRACPPPPSAVRPRQARCAVQPGPRHRSTGGWWRALVAAVAAHSKCYVRFMRFDLRPVCSVGTSQSARRARPGGGLSCGACWLVAVELDPVPAKLAHAKKATGAEGRCS